MVLLVEALYILRHGCSARGVADQMQKRMPFLHNARGKIHASPIKQSWNILITMSPSSRAFNPHRIGD